MDPPAKLDYSLQALLEELSQDELSKFKSLWKALPQKREQLQVIQAEVDEADTKQLAEIIIKHYVSYWVSTAAICVFGSMNRMDLAERIMNVLREAAMRSLEKNKPLSLGIKWTEPPVNEEEEEIIRRLEEGDPELKKRRIKDRSNQKRARRFLEGTKPGKEDKYRGIIQKKLWKAWKNNGPRESDYISEVTQRVKMQIPLCDPRTFPGVFPLTVVLHGPAGFGKTTLSRKVMLDWTDTLLDKTFRFAFYITCKELNRMGPCTFIELISKDWPEWQDDLSQVLAQAYKILVIIDGFEDLKVPEGALIQDICGEWDERKPVHIILSSILIGRLLPSASILITTRTEAMEGLQLLVNRSLFLEIEGFLEQDRKAYFLRHFEDKDDALQALDLVKSNAALFRMSAAPAVCWIICTCLKLQMERGRDPAPSCLTTTSLFLRFLCGQFMPAPGGSPSHHLRGPLRTLCLLAAQGTWTQTWVFDAEDLGSLGVQEADLRPFLDKGVLHQGRDCEGCYSFVHLSIQQLLAATFYILEREEEDDDDDDDWESHTRDIGDVQKLFSKEERLKNPNLIQVGYFLFGLSNEKRAQELEMTFGCRVSLKIREELLKYKANLDENKPFSETDTKEFLYCLYESQDQGLVKDAMARFKQMSLHLRDKTDMMHSAFCLKHCRHLQKIWLHVTEEVFLENGAASEPQAQLERPQDDRDILRFWREICSMFGLNKNLTFLKIKDSFFGTSSAQLLCQEILSTTCNLQKVVLKNISPADFYQNFCYALSRHKTLTHLTLQGNDQNDTLPSLCEILRHPKCNLQYLRLVSCSATPEQWADLSKALETNQSLTCLILSGTKLMDEGLKLLHASLRHPKSFLQKLLLENCHLTEACCKNLASALIVNQRLTHLCLAENTIGDRGMEVLFEGLGYPECKLQVLVLWHCNITDNGCKLLSKVVRQKSSLTHLDLGLNHIGTIGLRSLCEALKEPLCNLRCLWLWGCSITRFSCEDLATALGGNQSLITLDLGQNTLGFNGIKMLCEALKRPNCPLQTLRLKIDKYDPPMLKLLEDMKESNAQLTIENDLYDPRKKRPSSHYFIL
nr:NACHT, LRR and PYD domains-containing protein 2 isoform X2 [Microcebus murinus]XP_020139044.1 NACHT, LRR and PYD domains-containing protein 2 isoform X2 [Microcebus murinus]XP_020139045.1 NACHT, LRR and PYD domains-containing protein 2 isoform X2 [Microcebus murinus]XP_020139046.1 NACHT, LRR and PYD domains-containing protein 2 isoform X2 [Microcebus murinus]